MDEPVGIHEHGYTCRQIVDLAAEYLEGALPSDESTLFELHLDSCEGCFTFVNQIRDTAGLAAQVEHDTLPETLRADLLQAFRDWKHA
jgi:predicted anti-sigma-YlaC factor YlaD